MTIENEYQDNPKAPETTAERIQAIKGMIDEQFDDVQPGAQGDEPRGEVVQADDVRQDDSGSGAVDTQEPDAVQGVDDDPETTEAVEATDSEVVTLATLAEHLQVEPSDVYELEIPIGEGVSATLGQLKDEFKEYGPAKEYQAELQRKNDDFERQVLATRSELSAIVNSIPPEIRDQVIAAGRAHQGQWAKDQEKAVLEAIPDWADADNRAKDRANIVADGAEYGFSEQEITYTQDARTLRFMRDFSKMKRELQEMRAAAKAQPGVASPPGKPLGSKQTTGRLKQALIRKGKKDPTIQGKASVVSQMIRNQ